MDDTFYGGDAGRREGKLSRLLLCVCVLEVFALSFPLSETSPSKLFLLHFPLSFPTSLFPGSLTLPVQVASVYGAFVFCLFISVVKVVCKFALWQLRLSELLFYVPFSSPAHVLCQTLVLTHL